MKQKLQFPEDLKSSVSVLENSGGASYIQLIYDARLILTLYTCLYREQMERNANERIRQEQTMSSSESKKRKIDYSNTSEVEEMNVPATQDEVIGEWHFIFHL